MQKMRKDDDKVIAVMHYPPFDAQYNSTPLTALLEQYGVDTVTYGHLHGKNARVTPELKKGNVRYVLTSCDLIGYKLVSIFG